MSVFHISLDIRGALKNRSFHGFTDDEGNKVHWRKVKKYLEEELDSGKRLLPMSQDCKKFDFQNGCKCREVIDE